MLYDQQLFCSNHCSKIETKLRYKLVYKVLREMICYIPCEITDKLFQISLKNTWFQELPQINQQATPNSWTVSANSHLMQRTLFLLYSATVGKASQAQLLDFASVRPTATFTFTFIQRWKSFSFFLFLRRKFIIWFHDIPKKSF